MTLEIRPVAPADVDAIAALARLIWQDAYAAIITQAQIDYMLDQRYNAPRLLAELAAWPDAARILIAVALIFPLGFAMGMPFPLGMSRLAAAA